MDHTPLMDLITRMRAYCPVAVQDEADTFFAPIREALTPAIIRPLTAEERDGVALLDDEEEEDDAPELVIECPHCHAVSDEHKYIEDIGNERSLNGINEDGTLIINGHYETEGYDDGDNGRLACGACYKSFAIPTSLEIDFE